MRGVFFYTIGIAFTSGIFFRSFFDMGMSGIGLLLLVGFGVLGVWRMKARSFQSPLFLISITLISFACGVFRLERSESHISSLQPYEGKEVALIGRIVREPEVRENNIHLYVTPSGVKDPAPQQVLVTFDRFKNSGGILSYGDVVKVKGVLTVPQSFETDTGRVFDYVGYLKSKGVTHTIPSGSVEIQTEEQGAFLGYTFKGKAKFMEAIEDAIPEPHAGLGEGILLGVKRALPQSLTETFRETGIIHIVVLSGYNIMIVVECLMFVLSYIFFPRTRMVIGILCIALFALLVGLSATVLRASVMATLLIIARSTGRIYAVLRALMLTGMVMLIINPYLLVHDPGFQLSFLATLGLILLSPYIQKRLTLIPETVGLRNVVTATIATQIFILPLLLYHTGMFSLVSVLVNALVLPMVPVAMFLTFFTGMVGIFSNFLAYIIGFFTHLSLGYIISVAEIFGALPFASVQIGVFPFWIVFIAYAFLTVFFVYTKGDDMQSEILVSHKKVDRTKNEYEGWVIEEEKEVSPETKDTFPFR